MIGVFLILSTWME